MWRIMMVEDDAGTRMFFADSVRASAALQLVASEGSVAAACGWLDGHAAEVDALLIDLGLPDGSGLDVIRHARALNPQIEPLVISMFGDADNVLASIEAGALGYIHKDATPASIADTILAMRAGASPISPMIARLVLSKYRTEAPVNTPSPPTPAILLTRREQDILELLSQGHSYSEIANMRFLSVHTIQSHIKSLYRKLSVGSKTEAVYQATRIGLLKTRR
jgi:DNA-binding NarL/FixJ family response regulator